MSAGRGQGEWLNKRGFCLPVVSPRRNVDQSSGHWSSGIQGKRQGGKRGKRLGAYRSECGCFRLKERRASWTERVFGCSWFDSLMADVVQNVVNRVTVLMNNVLRVVGGSQLRMQASIQQMVMCPCKADCENVTLLVSYTSDLSHLSHAPLMTTFEPLNTFCVAIHLLPLLSRLRFKLVTRWHPLAPYCVLD